MKHTVAAVLASGALLVMPACEFIGPEVCTTEAKPSLLITVSDSMTAEPVTGAGVRVIASTAGFADTVGVNSNGLAVIGHERAGRFRVQVDAPGYFSWVREGVRVTADECHVVTADVSAKLRALPVSEGQ